MGDVLKFVTPDGRRVANGPTSSGRNRPKPGNISPNPKTNLKPKSCREKKTKLKLGLKN